MLMSMFLVGCAMKVAPTGGPRDTAPAVVVETEPRNGSTNISNPVVRFVFDDYVDRSVRNAITVLPATRFQTNYSGDEIDITFNDSLVPNTTYTVTLGTTWTDVRGNTPTQSYSVVFSTGPMSDSGVVAGSVYGASLAAVTVFCYPQQQFDSLTFSPSKVRPRYYQALGTTGSFAIRGLADGRYRVLAVRDENRNTLLDGTEDFCVASHDVVIRNGTSDQLALLLSTPLDTVGPLIQRVQALNQHVLSVQLSEPSWYMDRSRSATVASGDRIDSAQAVWLAAEPSDKLFVRVARPLDTLRYTLDIPPSLLRDSIGLSAVETSAGIKGIQFRGSRLVDTAQVVRARRIPSDSAQDLGLNDPLQVVFLQPLDTTSARFEVWHTSERGAHTVRLQWLDPTTLQVFPSAPRLPQTWYTTEITMSSIRALNGTSLRDTTLRIAHRTQQRPADPGTVRGRLVDSMQNVLPSARLVVRLLNDKRRVIATQRIDSTRSILFEAVPPGTYSVDVFDDRNGNGRYDHGSITPWIQGEQWWPTSSTVSVRPRWTVEDLRVVMGL